MNLNAFFIEMAAKEAEPLTDDFVPESSGLIIVTMSPSYFPFETSDEYLHFEKMVEKDLRAYFGMSAYVILDTKVPRNWLHISVNYVTDCTIIDFVKNQAPMIIRATRKAQEAMIESLKVSGDTL